MADTQRALKAGGMGAALHLIIFACAIGLTVAFLSGAPGGWARALYASATALFDLFAVLNPILTWYDVKIEDGRLAYSWKLPRRQRLYPLAEVEGYYSMLLPSRYSEYLTYYPVAAGRVLPSISTFAFDGAQGFVKDSGIRHLGRLEFSWGRYFVEILLRKRIDSNPARRK